MHIRVTFSQAVKDVLSSSQRENLSRRIVRVESRNIHYDQQLKAHVLIAGPLVNGAYVRTTYHDRSSQPWQTVYLVYRILEARESTIFGRKCTYEVFTEEELEEPN